MLNLQDVKITHKVFGEGTVLEQTENQIKILFKDKGEKKFIYPDAFENFLKCKDDNLQKEVLDFIVDKRESASLMSEKRREIYTKNLQEAAEQAKLKAKEMKKSISKTSKTTKTSKVPKGRKKAIA